MKPYPVKSNQQRKVKYLLLEFLASKDTNLKRACDTHRINYNVLHNNLNRGLCHLWIVNELVSKYGKKIVDNEGKIELL